jgi:hypothetical protein
MYELLTGARPFRQEDLAALAQAQVDEKPVAPREFKPQLRIPKFMEKAIMQALEKKPRRRQQSAGEFLEQLQAEIVPEEEESRGMWARARAAVTPRPPSREEAPAKEEAQTPPPPPPKAAPAAQEAAATQITQPSPEEQEPITVLPEVAGISAALASMGGSAAPGAQGKHAAPVKPAAPAKAAVSSKTAAASRPGAHAQPAEEPEEAKAAAKGVVEPEGPRLLRYDGKKLTGAWALDKPELTVGRSPECDIMIDDRSVSRVHASIYVRPDGVVVKDRVSLNGTYVNDDVVTGKAHVEDGDLVSFGSVGLVFRNA